MFSYYMALTVHFWCVTYLLELGLGLELESGHSFHAYASSMIVFFVACGGILYTILHFELFTWN